MKTQIGLYVDVSTAENLRARAASQGLPIGDLADVSLRYALERLTDETLQKWAATRVSSRGRLGGGLTNAEQRLFAAFAKLKVAQAPAWRFLGSDLATSAGLKLTEAFLALQRLQSRGLVFGIELEEQDRWGRPVKSFWCLTTDKR